SDTDEFGLILKTGLERMGCALAALWVPDKNIALSLTRSGQPMSPESLQRAQHHLMAWMQLQQRTIVVNHISKVASDGAAPYKILACPVRHPSERVMGVLALFNPPSAQDFDLHQTRIAEVLAKRATSIIQAQYDTSTGLMTRQAFERQATALLGSAASRSPGGRRCRPAPCRRQLPAIGWPRSCRLPAWRPPAPVRNRFAGRPR